MRKRTHRPDRLDIAAFVAAGEPLAGRWLRSELPRFESTVLPPEPAGTAAAPIDWQAQGELRRPRAGAPEPWLRVTGQTSAHLVCQRCLEPVHIELAIDRWFRFAPTAEEAERLDADLDDDVLVTSTAFDLRALVEDELLLALPLVPRHETCPVTLDPSLREASDADDGSMDDPVAGDATPGDPPKRSPFAELAADWHDAQRQRRKKPGTVDH